MTAWLGVSRSPVSSKAKPARRLGCFAYEANLPIDPILGKDGLNSVPKGLVHNRRMLSGIGIALVGDLTAIDAILQHEIEGAAGELLAAVRRAVCQNPPLAPDLRFFQFSLEEAHRSHFYIAPEDVEDSTGLVLIDNHALDIAAMDLFVAPTIGFDLLYAFVIVRLDRRDLVWINVTANPTAEWIARQITEAFPWDDFPQHLIRDRDRIYGTVVTRRLRAMGIRDKPTAPASPWQNGFAERLIGSIRRECVDHFVVLGEAHLRKIRRAYARYYNDIRTHRSLDKDAPVSRPVQRTGIISSHAILGGLHHHYVRA